MNLKIGLQRNVAYVQSVVELWNILKEGRSIEPLLERLSLLRGPLFKVLQVLATMPGVWSSPIAARLQMVVKPRSVVGEQEWKAYVAALCPQYLPFLQLEHAYFGSLGQVHPMKGSDGVQRACKIRYPNIEAVLAQDFRWLEIWNMAYTWWGAAIETAPLIGYLKYLFQDELDYRQEGAWMQRFAQHFEDVPWVHIPHYYAQDSQEDILVMSWVEGNSFSDEHLARLSQEDRNILSQRLVKAWYHPFFTQGLLHADPHIGNYVWDDQLHIHIVDFGSVYAFDAPWVEGAKKLYFALLNQDDTESIYYEYFGFSPLSALQKDCIDRWAHFLYGPFLQEGVYTLPMTLPAEGLALLKSLHQALRTEAPLKIPGEFLILDRACVALGATLVRLQGNVNWRACFGDMMAGREVT